MIINSLPYSISGNRIRIESWNRAPLGLTEGTRANLMQFASTGGTLQQDFVLSPYRYEDWSDMWRFEMQVEDQQGLLQSIIETFDELGIIVLSSESRKAFDDNWTIKHCIINCRAYSSKIDGTFDHDINSPRERLIGLEDYFYGKFAIHLRYSGDVYPRLSIERNWPHWGLAKLLEDNTARRENQLRGPFEVEFEKKGIFKMPEVILKDNSLEIYDASKTNAIYVSTNTRSKILYLNSYSQSHNEYVSVAIYLSGQPGSEKGGVLARVLKVIGSEKGLDLNIVRHQLRPGTIGVDKAKIKEEGLKGPNFTLNLLLHSTKIRHESQKQLYNKIEEKIKNEFAGDAYIKWVEAEGPESI